MLDLRPRGSAPDCDFIVWQIEAAHHTELQPALDLRHGDEIHYA